jgi:hypothetical protein
VSSLARHLEVEGEVMEGAGVRWRVEVMEGARVLEWDK